jgi:hypothetical protein
MIVHPINSSMHTAHSGYFKQVNPLTFKKNPSFYVDSKNVNLP